MAIFDQPLPLRVIPYEINQEKTKMFLTNSDFDKKFGTHIGTTVNLRYVKF